MPASFVAHRAALETTVLRTLARGSAHAGVAGRIDALLLLTDRLLAAGQGGKHETVPGQLAHALENLRRDPEAADVQFSHALEAALKLVLHHAGPEVQERVRQKRKVNLYDVMPALGLLDREEVELDVAEAHRIVDEVRRACLVAKEERNGTTHDGSRPRLDAAVALLAAVDLHRVALRESLATLVPAVPPLDALEGQLAEFQHHARAFVGREAFLEDLEAAVASVSAEGGYVLLHGPEGNGKSAVIAAMARTSAERRPLLGIGAPEAARRAPWLGVGPLVFGKAAAGRSPVEVATLLVRQANARLLAPVDEPRPDARPAEARGHLQRALGRLAEEAGRALFVVDALDELDPDVLTVLPAHLGAGIVGVVTCRSGHPAYRRALQALRPRERALPGLTSDETRALLRVRSGQDDAAWAERLHEVSGGSPLHVRIVADEVKVRGDLDAVDPRAGFAPALQARVERWRSPGLRLRDDPARNALYILALLEPVGPVAWDVLADLLTQRGCDVRADELREELAQHGAELIGVADEEVKLAARPLAEHVRDRVLTGRLRAAELERLAEGFAALDPIPEALLAAFVSRWEDDRDGGPAVAQLIDRLAEAGCHAELAEMARLGMRGRERAPAELVRGLRLAADADSRAAVLLGACLVQGLSMDADPEAGLRYLEAAVGAGHVGAAAYLGQQRLHGLHVPRDVARAEHLLREAHAQGSRDATLLLVQAGLAGLFGQARPGLVLEVLRERPDDLRVQAVLAAVLAARLAGPAEPGEVEALRERLRAAGEEGEDAVGWVRMHLPALGEPLVELGLSGEVDGHVLSELGVLAPMGATAARVLLAVHRLATDPDGALAAIRAALDLPGGAVAVAELAFQDQRLAPLHSELVDALDRAARAGAPRAAGLAGLLCANGGDATRALAFLTREPDPNPLMRLTAAVLRLQGDEPGRTDAALEVLVEWVQVGPIRERLPSFPLATALDRLWSQGTAESRVSAAAALASVAAECDPARVLHDSLQETPDARFAWIAEVEERAGLFTWSWLCRFPADLGEYREAVVRHELEERLDWLDAAAAWVVRLEGGEAPAVEGDAGRALALLLEAPEHGPGESWWEAADRELAGLLEAAGGAKWVAAPVWARVAADLPEARVAATWLWRHGATFRPSPMADPALVPGWLVERAPVVEEPPVAANEE